MSIRNTVDDRQADIAPLTGTVVLVNDDAVQLMALEGLVKKTGLDPIGYRDAERALASMDPGNPPLLIVTDIYMPGIDGWRLCRLLRSEAYEAFNRVPILVVSATFAGDEPSRIAADLGAEAFLPCPIDGEEFVETLWGLLEGQSMSSRPRILIVDDDRPFGDLLARQFSNHGYRPTVTHSYAEAEAAFAGNPYAVAVIDEQLPDGKGHQLLTLFHEMDSSCALITMSGMADPTMYLEWMKRGASASLHKPFDFDYLLEVCGKVRRERALLRVEDLLEVRTQELQHREREYRSLIDGVPDVIVRLRDDGRCLFVSDNVDRLYGEPSDNWSGKHFTDCGLGSAICDVWRDALDEVLQTGAAVETEFTIRTPNDEERIFNWRLLPERRDREGGGDIQSVLTLARDVTAHKQAEREREKLQAQLVHAQKMETVGRLAGGVAHDFNNMLGIILGNAELAMDFVEADAPLFDNLSEVRNAAVRSSAITRQLLAFSRKQSVAPVVLDLNEQIDGVFKMLRRLMDADISIQWTPGDSVWTVKMDPCQVDQLLVNLCVNARDAIDSNTGNIWIRTDNQVIDREFCEHHPGSKPGAYVRLQVRDNGKGMDASVREHVFEPFYTTKAVGEGTGMGLATVYGIVKQNRGYIALQSQPGEGTTFAIYLPRVSPEPKKDASVNERAMVAMGHGESVMIVEDEPAILNLGKVLLERNGYAVLPATSPVEALRMAREHSGRLHLLVTDVIMPEMNGRQLAGALSELFPGLKCLFMSGYTADVISKHGILDEGVNFIQKPFSGRDLLAKVQVMLTEGTPLSAVCPPVQSVPVKADEDSDETPLTVDENAQAADFGENHHLRLRRHLNYQHRMESVARLARGIAHDCNNLIMVIQWYAEQALSIVDADHPSRPWLGKITTAAQASGDLTRKMLSRQLLEFAGSQNIAPEVLDVNAVLTKTERFLMMLVGDDVKLSFDLTPDAWPVYIDFGQFDQILANLCLNAKDALGERGGAVSVATENVTFEQAPRHGHGHCQAGDYLRLRIRDNGCGIENDVQERIFEPSFTTKTDMDGGVGLPTVLGIVKQCKGWLCLDSRVGVGTCFDVYLPRCQEPVDA